MNTFSPFIVIEDSEVRLHLKENKFRQGIKFFITRILPIVFIAICILTAVYASKHTPTNYIIFLSTALTIISGFLFTRTYNTEIIITKPGFDIFYSSFFKVKRKHFPVSDIEHITCRMRRGKGGGLYYNLITKGTKAKIQLLVISPLYMSKTKQQLINRKLEQFTQLPVIVK